MFEINRKDKIIEIKYNEQKIEYPIEETQKLIDDLPDEEEYKKQNILDKFVSLIHNPIISIPGRILWLVGRLSIAIFAVYGIYVGLDFITSHLELYVNFKYMNESIFIYKNFAKFIQIYVLYDIVTTLVRLYFDVKYGLQRLKSK